MAALSKFKPAQLAIVDKSFAASLAGFIPGRDTSAKIYLTHYAPDELKYSSHTSKDNLAVFSEIYYPEGWNAKIDGKSAQILRVNYTLRAIVIPAGTHVVEMKFESKSYIMGQKIALGSSALIVLLVFAGIAWGFVKKKPGNSTITN
jgi:uncharacterized membrane protein YfhO